MGEEVGKNLLAKNMKYGDHPLVTGTLACTQPNTPLRSLYPPTHIPQVLQPQKYTLAKLSLVFYQHRKETLPVLSFRAQVTSFNNMKGKTGSCGKQGETRPIRKYLQSLTNRSRRCAKNVVQFEFLLSPPVSLFIPWCLIPVGECVCVCVWVGGGGGGGGGVLGFFSNILSAPRCCRVTLQGDRSRGLWSASETPRQSSRLLKKKKKPRQMKIPGDFLRSVSLWGPSGGARGGVGGRQISRKCWTLTSPGAAGSEWPLKDEEGDQIDIEHRCGSNPLPLFSSGDSTRHLSSYIFLSGLMGVETTRNPVVLLHLLCVLLIYFKHKPLKRPIWGSWSYPAFRSIRELNLALIGPSRDVICYSLLTLHTWHQLTDAEQILQRAKPRLTSLHSAPSTGGVVRLQKSGLFLEETSILSEGIPFPLKPPPPPPPGRGY